MRYPALDIIPVIPYSGGDRDRVFFFLDDYSPTAIEEHDDGLTAFFSDQSSRDRAREGLAYAIPGVMLAARDVDDEDWARRSQENLPPVTVGRITIVSASPDPPDLPDAPDLPDPPVPLALVIAPSMGFGTGHHATTRLCLEALQRIDLAGATVLDVGTGSGILALAARLLGAAATVGIDDDRDAIRSARENLQRNHAIDNVTFEVADARQWLADRASPGAHVVTANLTGALLQRIAPLLIAATRPGGRIIVSGVLADERHAVDDAFHDAEEMELLTEQEWVAIVYRKHSQP